MSETLQLVRAKRFLDDASVTFADVVPVFHKWIQTKAVDDLLLDVADYGHVHQGPGVLLLAHAAHYALDNTDGRLGVLHARRRDDHGTLVERFARVLTKTDGALALLRADASVSGKLGAASTSIRFEIADRLHAPNDDDAFARYEAPLREALARTHAAAFTLERRGDPRGPLSIDITLAG